MNKIIKKSPVPFYLAALVWILWAISMPLYQISHFVILSLLSAAVYFLSAKVFKGQEIKIEPPPLNVQTDNAEIHQLIEEGNRAIKQMRELNEKIADDMVSANIDKLQEYTEKIFEQVIKTPKKMPQIRKFLNYYLPTTLKILSAYEKMESQGVAGENISATMQKIETLMSQVTEAFKNQLDSLFGEEAMDISTDITVLENMMAREGFSQFNLNYKKGE